MNSPPTRCVPARTVSPTARRRAAATAVVALIAALLGLSAPAGGGPHTMPGTDRTPAVSGASGLPGAGSAAAATGTDTGTYTGTYTGADTDTADSWHAPPDQPVLHPSRDLPGTPGAGGMLPMVAGHVPCLRPGPATSGQGPGLPPAAVCAALPGARGPPAPTAGI